MGNAVAQIQEVSQTRIDPNLGVMQVAFFNADGTPATGRDETLAPVVTGSAIGTVAKSTTAPLPRANTIVPITFTNGNSANTPTLAFATGGAKAILLGGTAVTSAKAVFAAGGIGLFFFDGTALHQVGTYT